MWYRGRKSKRGSSRWLRTELTRSTASISAIGQRKLSDAIKLQLAVEPDTRPADFLAEAVYDIPDGNLWLTMQPGVKPCRAALNFAGTSPHLLPTKQKQLSTQPSTTTRLLLARP